MAAVRSRGARAPVVLGGLVVALVVLALPGGLVETIVASSGLSEAWPAAAPPLGLKARLLLAGFGALMGMGFACCGGAADGAMPRAKKEIGRQTRARGVSRMGFALPKLTWLSRSRAAGPTRISRPSARRADAHPDAPVRAPIFASRDFGGLEIFPRIAPARSEQADGAEPEIQALAQPLDAAAPATADLDPQSVKAELEGITAALAAAQYSQDAVQPAAPAPGAPSIAELTARLERGLAQRVRETRAGSAGGVIADMPVEHAVPVRDRVEDDVDQALRTALGALRAMAERTR